MKKLLTVVVEKADTNYSCYLEGLDGIIATGSTVAELKTRITEAIELYIDTCKEVDIELPEQLYGDYELAFKMDVASLLGCYTGIFTKSGLERITGVNQKLLWHYANGIKEPRPQQRVKIENALHRLGEELIAISL